MQNSFPRCMPVGSLPYEDDSATTKMMVKLYEKIPYLALLPKVDIDENLLFRTLSNIPNIKFKGKNAVLVDDAITFRPEINALDVAFNNPTMENLEPFGDCSYFLPKYMLIINRLKPAYTVINLLGPLTASQILSTEGNKQIASDRLYRKLLVEAVAVKALWFINEIKSFSPNTTPIVVLEEPLLYKIGELKRENEDITQDVIVNFFAKTIEKIKEAGAKVCIQSFEKCDWQIPIKAGVDIISFDAYHNPNNINIISDKISSFLRGGGIINWGIVPVKNETLIKSLSVEKLYDRFIDTISTLIMDGVDEKLIYNNAMVSTQGDLENLPLFFAEKALILSTQLAKRIPFKN